MEKELFNDLVSALHEAVMFEKGEIQLKTTTLEIPDEEIEKAQLFFQKFDKLSAQHKQQAIDFVEDLLQTS